MKICLFPYVFINDTSELSADFRSAATQELISQRHRKLRWLANHRSIVLYSESSPVVSLLQSSRGAHSRDAALLKVTEGTVRIGAKKHGIWPKGEEGWRAVVLIMAP